MKIKLLNDLLFGFFITFIGLVILNMFSYVWLAVYNKETIVLDVKKSFLNQFNKELKKDNNNEISKWLTIDELNPLANKNNDFYIHNKSNALILYCEESSGFIKYKSDIYGFRNDPSLNKYNVLFVGDSATEGACVNNKDTITSVINKQKNIKAFNGGKGGTGLAYFALSARKLNAELKPNIIAVNLLQGVSINRMVDEFERFPNILNFKPKFTDSNKEWQKIKNFSIYNAYRKNNNFEKQIQINQLSFIENLKNLIRTTSLYQMKTKLQFNNIYYDGEGVPSCQKLNKNIKLIKRVLFDLKNTAQKNNTDLIIFYIPTFWNFMQDVDKNFYNKIKTESNCEINLVRKIIGDDPKIIIKDMRYVFDDDIHKKVRKKYFADNHVTLSHLDYVRGHYSEKGFAKMAGEMKNLLQDSKL